MSLRADRDLTKRILELMPCNEEDLALALGTTREHIASLCTALYRRRKIKRDPKWDVPVHWMAR